MGTHKSEFVELTTNSLLVGHIWFVICHTYGHYKSQISPTKSQLGPNPTCPLFTMGNPIVKTDPPRKYFVTQSLTTHFWWLVSHFKPMGVSFHRKKPEFYGGGTNRVFCHYFIDLTRSMAKKTRKLSTIGTFFAQITQLPLKFNLYFSF